MDILSKLKLYADLRLDEAKLKIAGGLSSATSAVIRVMFGVSLAILALAFAAVALEQWLSDTLGRPWGALIVCVAMALAAVLVLCLHKKGNSKSLDRIFSSSLGLPPTDNIKAESEKLGMELKLCESSISGDCRQVSDSLQFLSSFLSLFKRIGRRKKEE